MGVPNPELLVGETVLLLGIGSMLALTALAGAGMRFPYSSPCLRGPSDVGGAPNPNLPLGTGTPPFLSNFAILSRKPVAGVLPLPGTGEPLVFGDVGRELGTPEAEFLCSRAAIRSLRFVTGIWERAVALCEGDSQVMRIIKSRNHLHFKQWQRVL